MASARWQCRLLRLTVRVIVARGGCPWSVNIGDERGALLPLCASYGVLKCNQECELCSDPVLLSDFYLFPCLHAFHSKCLFNEVR